MAASGKYPTRDLLKTIELYPKRNTVSNIEGVAITPLKKFVLNSLRKFLIESSVSKSVATVDSPQSFFKFISEQLLSVKTLIFTKLKFDSTLQFQGNLVITN